MQYNFIISIFIPLTYLSTAFFLHKKNANYIEQWNAEREYSAQEKLKLKRRPINANVAFIMTAIGRYGNSNFAMNNKSVLKKK